MAKPLQKFARVNLNRFERLCAEVEVLVGAESMHEGEVIAQRMAGDPRVTAFVGWSVGKSARDCRNRMQFAMRQVAQTRGREVTPPRLLFIAETEFRALCAKPRIGEEFARLEAAQQPVDRGIIAVAQRRERQELLRMVADVAVIEERVRQQTAQQTLRVVREEIPVEEDVSVCACLSRVYMLTRQVGLLEGEPLVPQPDHRELRARVVAQMEREAQRPPRRHHRRRRWHVPKEQLGLWKEAKG